MRAIPLIMLMVALWASGGAQETPSETAPKPPAQTPSPEKTDKTSADTLTLDFKEEGERWWWAEDTAGNPLTPPQKTQDAQTTLQPPQKTAVIWVLDAKAGNLARIDPSQQHGKITLKSDKWSHVARLQVNIRKDTLPVASALVVLTDSEGKTHRQVLDPTAEGMLLFERVPMGKISVRVQYGTNQSTTQEMTLERERRQIVPVLDVLVSGEVATVKPARQAQSEKAEQPASSSLLGTIIMAVVAGVLAIAVIVLLVRLAKQKEQPLSEMMQKLGVELPSGQSASQPATTTASAQTSMPDLPPLESAGVPPTAPSHVSASGVPTRIVGTQGAYVGVAFSLEADLLTVGRDSSNGIVLDQENTVSRRHAQFIKQGDTLCVEDLGSTNGTFVNGMQISSLTPVRPGDVVQFGACAFRVE